MAFLKFIIFGPGDRIFRDRTAVADPGEFQMKPPFGLCHKVNNLANKLNYSSQLHNAELPKILFHTFSNFLSQVGVETPFLFLGSATGLNLCKSNHTHCLSYD